jgi:hypothetical protein
LDLIGVRVLACASSKVHIRSCDCSWSHVMEHDWTLCVPSSFLVKGRTYTTSAKLYCTSLVT